MCVKLRPLDGSQMIHYGGHLDGKLNKYTTYRTEFRQEEEQASLGYSIGARASGGCHRLRRQ
ncbi:uncharacterized protein METZ01_LOCUS284775, partial [marine metagenome]